MTNLDSILKSRDITLPTKVRLVKAMFFPVVMYGCEIWTIIDILRTFQYRLLVNTCNSPLVPSLSDKLPSVQAFIVQHIGPSSQSYGFSSSHVWM